MNTEIITDTRQAATRLANGQLVSFPTETVYGLGGDACNGKAVARIFAAKGRPQFNPLIIHVHDLKTAEKYAEFTDQARELARKFWPGPLTLSLPIKTNSGLSDLISAGLNTVAIRIPAHKISLEMLKEFGGPVAGPSANISGSVSPTTAKHVFDGLAGRIDAILDGGSCPVGLESTILGFADGKPILLRPGGLTINDIENLLNIKLKLGVQGSEMPTAPGQLSSHYATNALIRLNATQPHKTENWLGFGSEPDLPEGCKSLNLSPSRNLTEAAANLFAHLRELDQSVANIAVAKIPYEGLGFAINDRLKRAAAPRK